MKTTLYFAFKILILCVAVFLAGFWLAIFYYEWFYGSITLYESRDVLAIEIPFITFFIIGLIIVIAKETKEQTKKT